MTPPSPYLVVLLTLAASLTAAAEPRPPAPTPADAWSPSVEGLRGRLIVTPGQDAQHRPQLQLGLELENTADLATPIELSAANPSQMLALTLEDEAGKPVARDMVGGNEMMMPAYTLALPVRSRLTMTLASAVYEYVPSGRIMLRPFSFVAWDLPAKRTGKLYLRATLAPVEKLPNPRAWHGPLALPRVALP